MEMQVLYAIQELCRDWLDAVMVFLSTIGNSGICWIIISLLLAMFPKTRKCAVTMMISMALTFLFANVILKNVIARPRPYTADTGIILLIPYPSDYSFPSGHTANGITAAVTIFYYYRRAGFAAIILALAIAFSRLYLFVHYPTDIFGGLLIGIADAMLAILIVKTREQRKSKNGLS